jgi:hypothetical protein
LAVATSPPQSCHPGQGPPSGPPSRDPGANALQNPSSPGSPLRSVRDDEAGMQPSRPPPNG